MRHWDWSETSQTAWLFTRGHGFVRGLAKGSRRPGSAYSGGIELLTCGHAAFIIKPATELALITEWDLAETFPALRRSLSAHYGALYGAEVTQLMLQDHDAHPELFDALLDLLRGLQRDGSVDGALVRFQQLLLRWCGFEMNLDSDARTGEVFGREVALAFVPHLGGFVAGRTDAVPASERWPVRGATLNVLRSFANGSAGLSSTDPADVDAVRRAGAMLAAYIRYLIGSEPKLLGLVYGRLVDRGTFRNA